jgi:hypothetical protein
LHSPAWSQIGQSSGWLISNDSSTASRICFVAGELGYSSMPGEIGVAQPMAPRGVCGSYGRTDFAILGVPSSLSTGLRSGPIIGVPNSIRHMRQLPATGSFG